MGDERQTDDDAGELSLEEEIGAAPEEHRGGGRHGDRHRGPSEGATSSPKASNTMNTRPTTTA